MGYTTDFYKLEKNGELKFMCSADGSDAASYWDDIKTWNDVEKVFKGFYEDDDRFVWMNWVNPWKTSKISDNCIIFEEVSKKWYEFWKPKISLKVWFDTYYQKYESECKGDETKMYFSDLPCHKYYGTRDYKNDSNTPNPLHHLRLFNLPIMKK